MSGSGADMRCGVDHSDRTDKIATGTMVLGLLTLLLLNALSGDVAPQRGDVVPTRANGTVLFEMDPEAVDSDGSLVCLAGYRPYRLNFNISNVELANLRWINTSIVEESSSSVYLLSSYFLGDNKLTMELLDPEATVSSPGITNIIGQNFTYYFDVLFHMNWSYEEKFEPRLDLQMLNGETIRPDFEEDRTVQVFGTLDVPTVGQVLDEQGRSIEENSYVRSNSTLNFTGMGFGYKHPNSLIDLSGKQPLASELSVVLEADGVQFKAQWGPLGYYCTVDIPEDTSGSDFISMDITNIPEERKQRPSVRNFDFKLDGIGPSFLLRKPAGKADSTLVNWTLEVTDKPQSSQICVIFIVDRHSNWDKVYMWA